MNKDRRKAIAALKDQIEEIRGVVSALVDQVGTLRDEEQEYFDNMPESLQGGERGSVAEEAIGQLESAIESLEEIDSSIDMAVIALDSAAA